MKHWPSIYILNDMKMLNITYIILTYFWLYMQYKPIVEYLGNTEKHKEEKSYMISAPRNTQYKYFGAYPS